MYKPHTIEQFKVQQFLEHTFAIDHFLVSPLSRTALMLEDKDGERIAFSFSDNEVREIPIPPAADLEKVKAFIRQFHALDPKPHLRTSHPMIDDEDAWRMASSGLVSEDGYRDIQLWYFNGNSFTCWLGPLGVDGTGNLYALTFNYGTPRARELRFYLLDDYYRDMNHIL